MRPHGVRLLATMEDPGAAGSLGVAAVLTSGCADRSEKVEDFFG